MRDGTSFSEKTLPVFAGQLQREYFNCCLPMEMNMFTKIHFGKTAVA